jgi:hypothetical protein
VALAFALAPFDPAEAPNEAPPPWAEATAVARVEAKKTPKAGPETLMALTIPGGG